MDDSSETPDPITLISADMDQYFAVLYCDEWGPDPQGMITDARYTVLGTDVAARALDWVMEGEDYGLTRRASLHYFSHEGHTKVLDIVGVKPDA